jgi:hypothetical protein
VLRPAALPDPEEKPPPFEETTPAKMATPSTKKLVLPMQMTVDLKSSKRAAPTVKTPLCVDVVEDTSENVPSTVTVGSLLR